MGRDTAYWYRGGRGVLVGEGWVSFRGRCLRLRRAPGCLWAKAGYLWAKGARRRLGTLGLNRTEEGG